MKLCILDNDVLDATAQPVWSSYGAMFERWLRAAGWAGEVQVFSARQGEYPADWSAFDAVLLTGSRADAFGDAPWVQVLRQHVLRNALLPIVTFAGLQLGQVAGGAVLIETVFAWPGIGRLMFDALLQRDYQLLLGVFLVTSATVILFNLITDIAYRFVDPRIRIEGGAK